MGRREQKEAPRLAVSHHVHAAGGIVVRRVGRVPRRRRQILLVHRPKYDDWTFPKGKRDRGESDEETALREVAEETGFECRLGADLGDVTYRDSMGRKKVVRYWAMDLPDGEGGELFSANREVDEIRWLVVSEAGKLLTYDHDRVLIERLRKARG